MLSGLILRSRPTSQGQSRQQDNSPPLSPMRAPRPTPSAGLRPTAGRSADIALKITNFRRGWCRLVGMVILVRSRRLVNPEVDRNVRAGAGQNCSRAISNQDRAEVQGGRCDMWETPRASFIPAQSNALGSSAQNPISAESAIHPSSYQPPA